MSKDREHCRADNLSDVRNRILSNTTLLSVFNQGLSAYVASRFIGTSQLLTRVRSNSRVRIVKRLSKWVQEFRAGLRESSVMSDSSSLAGTIDSDNVWGQLQEELEDIGLSESVLKDNQIFITDWLKGAIRNGMLEEENPDWRPPAPSISGDSGYESSRYESYIRTYESTVYNSPTVNEMITANKEFAESIAESRTNSDRSKASSQQSVKVRKASTVSAYVFKLMRKDTEIIEAASDGDIKKVAKLISRGANVNARDRWGVSHLFQILCRLS
jgi:hypothetical protein